MYVDGERLGELLPEYVAGDTWLIGPYTFTHPQLERLDEQSWLFIISGTTCIAVLKKPRFEEGAFAGGAAQIVNRGIGHVLPRLGCVDGRVADWAAIPRVLPPSDLDMLCYELGLSDDDDIDPVLPDDDRTRELRAAVWDDPISDDARLVYADYLQDRGDPRGELVALQVQRARKGGHASEREKALVRRIAADCAQPLTPYLVRDFELERGFVARCMVDDKQKMPEAITWSPAWRTVDDLTTANYELLTSPHVRATRAGVSGKHLVRLVEHVRPLPFETVVGIAPRGLSQRGVWIEEGGWDTVMAVGALVSLHTLSVGPEMSGLGARLIPSMLRSPLGQRLRQLDAFIELPYAEPQRWRDAFDLAKLPLLTLRFIAVPPTRGARQWFKPEVLVGLRRTTRLPHLIVQVADVLAPDSVTELMRFIAQLSRNVQFAELHDFHVPRGQTIQERHALLLERLNAMFQQVLVQPKGARPLSP